MKISTLAFTLFGIGTTAIVFQQVMHPEPPQQPQSSGLPGAYAAQPDDCYCTWLYQKAFRGRPSTEELKALKSQCEEYRRLHCTEMETSKGEEFVEKEKDWEPSPLISESSSRITRNEKKIFNRLPGNSKRVSGCSSIKRHYWLDKHSEPGVFVVKKCTNQMDRDTCKCVRQDVVWRFNAPYYENLRDTMRTDEAIFLMLEKDESKWEGVDEYLPFKLPNDEYESWRTTTDAAEAARLENGTEPYLLFRERTGNKVWLVRMGEQVSEPRPGWQADWLESRQKEFAINLVLLSVAVPDVKIIEKQQKDNSIKALLKGTKGGLDFIVGVSENKFYQPIELEIKPDIQPRRILLNMLHSPQAGKLDLMYKKWLRDEALIRIMAILPPTSEESSPLKALGNPSSSSLMPPSIYDNLEGRKALDMLIYEENKGSAIWRANGTKEGWSCPLGYACNDPWTTWLLMADPNLQIVAQSDEDSTFLFIFKGSANALWAWKSGKDNRAPNIIETLKGADVCPLSGQSTKDLITSIKQYSASDKEKLFFLERAFNPASFQILDWRNSGESGRIILLDDCNKGDAAHPSIWRLGAGAPDQPIGFRLVDMAWNSWANIRPYYQNYRTEFDRLLLDNEGSSLEAWFSPVRFGVYYKEFPSDHELISVFPSCGSSRFEENIALSEVFDLVLHPSEITYMGRELSKDVLMEGWLSTDWRKGGNWRANPLGYLDRVQHNH